jgi:hypothetical protein
VCTTGGRAFDQCWTESSELRRLAIAPYWPPIFLFALGPIPLFWLLGCCNKNNPLGESRVCDLDIAGRSSKKVLPSRFKFAALAFDDGVRGIMLGHNYSRIAALWATASDFNRDIGHPSHLHCSRSCTSSPVRLINVYRIHRGGGLRGHHRAALVLGIIAQ